ncbi:MAG: hypothetical protein AAF518_25270 [Spirochaetota bacterium]
MNASVIGVFFHFSYGKKYSQTPADSLHRFVYLWYYRFGSIVFADLYWAIKSYHRMATWGAIVSLSIFVMILSHAA